jgi:hypothetical protein
MGNQQAVSLGDSIKDSLKLNLHGGEGLDPKVSAKKRLEIVGETLETEATYVKILHHIHFFESNLMEKKILDSAKCKTVFSVAFSILNFHVAFFQKLSTRAEKPLKEQGYYTLVIGDIFEEFTGWY